MTKKIVFLISNFNIGGTQRVTIDLANEFISQGFQVEIKVLHGNMQAPFKLDSKVSVTYLKCDRNKAQPWIVRFFKSLIIIRNSFANQKNVIVISQQKEQNIKSPLALAFKGAHIVCCEHSEYGRLVGPKRHLLNLFYFLFVRELVVLTNTDRNQYPFFIRRKSTVIANPVRNYIDVGVVQRSQIILSVGRLSPEKGYKEYLQFIARNKVEFAGWSFQIVGDGPLMSELKQQALTLQIDDVVHFVGAVKDASPYFLRAKIFYLPSKFEGFGLVLLEAMQLGLPVIASNKSVGASELINGDNGVLVDSDDNYAMLNTFKMIMNDERCRNHLSENGLRFSGSYAVPLIARNWISVLKVK